MYAHPATPTRRTAIALAVVGAMIPGMASAEGDASPRAVVEGLLDAMLANDAGRIHAAFAGNARQAYGSGSWKSGPAFRAWLDSDIVARHGRVEDATLAEDGDGAVVVTGEYRIDTGYRSAADFLMTVEDGRIASWRIRY